MKNQVLETASFHIIKLCNMKCKFCYATFNDFKLDNQLSEEEACIIIDKLNIAGVKKITFAGGEPMLYKHLKLAINYAKSIGMVTSIITNGSMITEKFLIDMKDKLDWIGISVDSLNEETNKKIGRVSNIDFDYFELVDMIKSYGYKLKINTVVNIHNQEESLSDFIEYSGATRWKVFDTLRVEGQNEKEFDQIKSNKYDEYLKRNIHSSMVAESNDLMTGSYLLIDPKGRLFENSKGKHTYSKSIIDNDFDECYNSLDFKMDKFLGRGGIYNY